MQPPLSLPEKTSTIWNGHNGGVATSPENQRADGGQRVAVERPQIDRAARSAALAADIEPRCVGE
jgi:hypothetical protein